MRGSGVFLIGGIAVALLLFSLALSPSLALGDRPVIGIFTEPTDGVLAKFGKSYLAASYVKYFESGGAQVVPIRYDAPRSELSFLFSSINGMVFPGGGVDLVSGNPYYEATKYMFELAMQANQRGDYFPVWGTCLGFELLMVLVSNNTAVLESGFDSENLALPLLPTAAASQSRLLGTQTCPSTVLHTVYTQAVTMNNHQAGISPQRFASTSALTSFFSVLSHNTDRKGREFVSTVEAFQWPVYGSQWHPEKNQFEWTPREAIPHSADGIAAVQYFADFFVNECRKNKHAFPDDKSFLDRSIYRVNPVYTGDVENFTQCYFWS